MGDSWYWLKWLICTTHLNLKGSRASRLGWFRVRCFRLVWNCVFCPFCILHICKSFLKSGRIGFGYKVVYVLNTLGASLFINSFLWLAVSTGKFTTLGIRHKHLCQDKPKLLYQIPTMILGECWSNVVWLKQKLFQWGLFFVIFVISWLSWFWHILCFWVWVFELCNVQS